ncbi:MAG: metalloregulator ArsR/SmtB family transcription factor [Aquificaceae bacterium]
MLNALEEHQLEEWAEFLKALGHPVRLRIIKVLIEGKQCVKNLSELLNTSQPNISQHLGILRHRGIVGCKRDGSVVCYFIRDERVLKIYEILKKEVISYGSFGIDREQLERGSDQLEDTCGG